ncbi:MAG: hypothetical protein ACM358_05985 [Gemmatimonadota bacterium]
MKRRKINEEVLRYFMKSTQPPSLGTNPVLPSLVKTTCRVEPPMMDE